MQVRPSGDDINTIKIWVDLGAGKRVNLDAWERACAAAIREALPDTQAFVPFTPPGGLFTVSVPEGWARSTDGAATIFTDKANTVRIETIPRADAPNTESVQVDELPAIASSTAGYRPASVTAVQRKAGPVIVITYQGTSAPNPVTGKAGTDAFERYDYWRNGDEVVLTLSGPAGADNVDPWRTITDSLQWT